MRLLFLAMLLIVFPVTAKAQPGRLLTVDLADKSVDITTGFDGAKLVLYGTKKEPGDIAVVIRGPDEPMVVRRKEQILGIWMNRRAVRFEGVQTYYDFALSRPERDIAPLEMLQRYDIGLDALRFETRDDLDAAVIDNFREALIRNRQAQGLFPLEPKPIAFLDDSFFRASFYLPANVPTGIYKVSTFLIRDGDVMDRQDTEIKVAQTGFSANVYLFAQTQSLAYGVMAVLIALFSGWGAYAVLRRE